MNICLATVLANPAFTPLALLGLKAQLIAHGEAEPAKVSILEFTDADSVETIVRRVLAGAPSVIGFSCYVWNVTALLSAASEIKHVLPQVRIVLGGPEVGPIALAVLERNPSVDCVVKSEGELVFSQLVRAWREGGDIGQVRGVCYRDGGGVRETGDAVILRDLNNIAPPLFLADGEYRDRIICVETQRGCVFRCTFCFEGKDLAVRNRRFDLERVKAELLHWLNRDIAWIYLMDPVFNLNAARAKELCRFIAAHNVRRIPLHAEIWAEFMDAEMAQLMREANFCFLEIGLQTTNEKALARAERRLKRERFLEGIEHLKRNDLPFQVQLIYGLPGETRESFRHTLNFAAALQAPDLTVFPLLVLPGTELRKQAATLRLEYDPAPPYQIRSHYSMTEEDVTYGLDVAAAVRGVGRLWTLRLLAREAGTSYADMIDDWVASAGQAECVADAGGHGIDRRRVMDFIRHFCALQGIAPKFYLASAETEFVARENAAGDGGTESARPLPRAAAC